MTTRLDKYHFIDTLNVSKLKYNDASFSTVINEFI